MKADELNRINSEQLFAQAKRIIPGGVDSPVRAFKAVGGAPLFIRQGKGSRITDEDGNSFIDYCMSWGPLILGHADDYVAGEVAAALKNGTSFGTPHKSEVELAELVTGAFAGIEKVRFVNSGTEATMSAIRLARGYTGRDKFIKFSGCYHGHGDHLLVAAGSGLATFGTPDSAGVTKANAADTVVLPFNDIAALQNFLAKDGKSVAAIIIEPVPCNYGLILPRDGYLQAIRDLCNDYGIVLIFDEVITGFRLSSGGAQKYFGIQADITTLGKIIGGGLPVGAYGGKAEIMDCVAPLGPVYQAGTLSGNPLAMAAGIATLTKLFEKDVYEELERKAEFFASALQPAVLKYKGRFLFNRIGSIFCFCFTDKAEVFSAEDVKTADTSAFAKFHWEMLKRGVYLSPSAFEVGFISLSHTDDDLAHTAHAVEEALAEVLG